MQRLKARDDAYHRLSPQTYRIMRRLVVYLDAGILLASNPTVTGALRDKLIGQTAKESGRLELNDWPVSSLDDVHLTLLVITIL